MIEHNLSTAVKVDKVINYTGAATTALTSAGVDMTGYDGVMFIATFGTGAANQTIEALSAATSGSATLTAITCNLMTGPGSTSGSSQDGWSKAYSATAKVTTAGSEPVAFIDVYRPVKRYVGVCVTPATSSTVYGVYAIRYRSGANPVINNDGSTVCGGVAQALS